MLVCHAIKAATPRQDRAERLRARRIAGIVRLTEALERGLAGDLAKLFDKIARHAASLARDGQPFAAPGVVDHYLDAIATVWRARQHAAAVEMARHTLKGLGYEHGKSAPPTSGLYRSRRQNAVSIKDHRTAAASSADQQAKTRHETKFISLIAIATAAISSWIAEHGGEKVRQIAEGTKRIIRRSLVRGNELNEPPRVLAKRIREETGGEIGRQRAVTIARTETHTAANVGADSAASATGLQLEDEWGATEDHRTRPAHAEADGQRVPHGQMFVVGGEALRFPGDPNGSPRNVINCRCVVLYRPVLPGTRGQ